MLERKKQPKKVSLTQKVEMSEIQRSRSTKFVMTASMFKEKTQNN